MKHSIWVVNKTRKILDSIAQVEYFKKMIGNRQAAKCKMPFDPSKITCSFDNLFCLKYYIVVHVTINNENLFHFVSLQKFMQQQRKLWELNNQKSWLRRLIKKFAIFMCQEKNSKKSLLLRIEKIEDNGVTAKLTTCT